VGLRVPQVPRNQGSFGLRYEDAVLHAGLIVRAAGAQYDDDLNQLLLGHAVTWDLVAGRAVGKGLEFYAAAENLFDMRYDVGLTPVLTRGAPRSVRAGVRLRLSPGP